MNATPPLPWFLLLAAIAALAAAMCVSIDAAAQVRVVEVETGPSAKVRVIVYPDLCYGRMTGAYADTRSPELPAVYLCGLPQDERHELDHFRGMRHTAWVSVDFISCATVTVAGYNTRYQVGQRVCMNKINRQEWTE